MGQCNAYLLTEFEFKTDASEGHISSKKHEVIAKYIRDMHAETSATATATPKPGCQSSADH
jgi:hypothetical protein